MWPETWNVDEAMGLPDEAQKVTRMTFNDSGEVQALREPFGGSNRS